MALVFFTDALFGNDTNSGSSEGGPIASGTNAVIASGNQIIDLSLDSPDLSTVASGDTIRIAGRTDGVNSTDIFEITSVNDGFDTVDVVQIPTSGGSSLAWAVGGAFKTIQKAVDIMDGNDFCWIKATSGYKEAVFSVRNGTATAPIIFEGYTNTIGDGGEAVLDGDGILTNGWTTFGVSAFIYHVFRNLRMTNFTNHGLNAALTSHMDIIRCRFDNNSADGARTVGHSTFTGCYFHNNGAYGLYSRKQNTVIACISNHNSRDGIYSEDDCVIYRCLVVGNGEININVPEDSRRLVVNCTVDGDGKVSTIGVNTGNTFLGGVSCFNNIIYDCQVGISSLNDISETSLSAHNLLYDNTLNYSLFETQFGEVLENPLFIDEDNLDYSLTNGSPAVKAGFDLSSVGWIDFSAQQIDIGAFLDPVVINENDSFGLNSPPKLERLLLRQDHHPQIIGRFDGSESGVVIRVWNVVGAENNELTLENNTCYEIGNTGRWGWSTQYLPKSNKGIQHYFYQMISDNTQGFEGLFMLNTNFGFPSNINEYISSV